MGFCPDSRAARRSCSSPRKTENQARHAHCRCQCMRTSGNRWAGICDGHEMVLKLHCKGALLQFVYHSVAMFFVFLVFLRERDVLFHLHIQ